MITESVPAFDELLFVPVLTADVAGSTEGRTPTGWFPSRPEILRFVKALRQGPKSLERIADLGRLPGLAPFEVRIHAPERIVGRYPERAAYFRDLQFGPRRRSVVFFDPDNGFETKTQDGPKWIRYDEVRAALEAASEDSVAVVYQHRPRKRWPDVLEGIFIRCEGWAQAFAVCEANLAFVFLAKTRAVFDRILVTARRYAEARPGLALHRPGVSDQRD